MDRYIVDTDNGMALFRRAVIVKIMLAVDEEVAKCRFSAGSACDDGDVLLPVQPLNRGEFRMLLEDVIRDCEVVS